MAGMQHKRLQIKRVDQPPYVLDEAQLQQYPQEKIIFNRVENDASWAGYQRLIDERVPEILQEDQPGYQRVDFALRYASWIVHDAFQGSFAWSRITKYRQPSAEVDHDLSTPVFEVEDPALMSHQVKRVAKLSGAAITGICRLNRKWLYADVEIPDKIDTAIIMAIEMDPDGIATSPAIPAAAATGVGYSRMGFILALLGEFIRNLGYNALQCGNDTALSIPLAIDAGLGQLGRHGLLITPEYGSRVRLCKLLTDLPLQIDKPIDFGVTETCTSCKQCAEACEVEAISMADEPTDTIACSSNNPGVRKWYVNGELCYQFWCKNGGDCSTCIAVCPYTKRTHNQVPMHSENFWNDI